MQKIPRLDYKIANHLFGTTNMRKISISCGYKYIWKPLPEWSDLGLMVKSASVWHKNLISTVNLLLIALFIFLDRAFA